MRSVCWQWEAKTSVFPGNDITISKKYYYYVATVKHLYTWLIKMIISQKLYMCTVKIIEECSEMCS